MVMLVVVVVVVVVVLKEQTSTGQLLKSAKRTVAKDKSAAAADLTGITAGKTASTTLQKATKVTGLFLLFWQSKGKDIPRRAHRRLVSRLGAHNLLPARPDWRQNASRRPVLPM